MEAGEVLKRFSLTLVSTKISDFPSGRTLALWVMDDLDALVVMVWMVINMADPATANQEIVVEIEGLVFFHITRIG